ncbi:MAG: hypothetical protein R3332_08375 [Pseudohongiellaceae bacterium]|nr:hypothetical protein [Pseudohongiellaceae bacterium]
MEFVDILKIVVPIILFMLAAIGGAIRWILDREEKAQAKEDAAQKEYWGAVHESLQRLVGELAGQFKEHKDEQSSWRERTDKKLESLEERFGEFRESVAGGYIKRDDWLSHAVNLERKVDNLRNDIHKELQIMGRSIAELGKNK